MRVYFPIFARTSSATHLDPSVNMISIDRIRHRADFEHLFRSHYSTLCSYASNFLRDPDASEEIVQEVMFKLWVNRESIVFESSPRSYLFRSVRNGCLNLLKHMNVREEYKAAREAQMQEIQRSQEDDLIVTELGQKIREAVDKLPLERRKVFVLSRYEGLTYPEIAARLGISVKTVENQMSSALKFLRTELAEYLPWLVLFFFEMGIGVTGC
jgi:RNA polymerase sigma-70 factor, ECF subfamily